MTKNQISLGDLMYNLMKIKDYYRSELNIENVELNDYVKDLEKRKDKEIDIKISQIEIDTKKYWKGLILDAIIGLLDTINNRKTKGSEFSKIIKDLIKTKEDIPYDDLDIETLRSIYEETLRERRYEIKEKIDIEKFNSRRFWIGIGIGFILGIIVSLIIWGLQMWMK